MTGATLYPPADHTSQWYGAGNATVSPNKLLWHTTETAGGWPGYSGGGEAPNLTYDPWAHAWRQHFPLNGTARALANAGSYSTNRAGVCQVEIGCYCDPSKFSTGKGIDHLDDQAYADLAAFSQFMAAEWGVQLASSVGWKPYPSSYGNNGVRLSTGQFDAYRGHCGHMHAPGNDHGDPGGIDVARIIGGAPTPPGPTPPPTPATEYRQNKQVYHSKMRAGQLDSDSVWNLTIGLNDHGVATTKVDDYTQEVVNNVAAFQRAQGWSGSDADGIAGPTTVGRLGLTWVDDGAPPAPAPPPPPPAPTYAYRQGKQVYSSKMHKGQANSDSVWNLQVALLAKGYAIPDGPTDYYGDQTVSACAAFQRAQGWTGSGADGICGPQTAGRLSLVWVNG